MCSHFSRPTAIINDEQISARRWEKLHPTMGLRDHKKASSRNFNELDQLGARSLQYWYLIVAECEGKWDKFYIKFEDNGPENERMNYERVEITDARQNRRF